MFWEQMGNWNFEFTDHNEVIHVQKPNLTVNNIIFGTIYFEVVGELVAINMKTQAKLHLKFHPRGWKTASKMEGTVKDKDGTVILNIEGSWLEEVFIVDPHTKQRESIWKSLDFNPLGARQYWYTPFTLMLNHLSPEIATAKERGEYLIAPTDTRFRPDQRLLENGKV